MSSKRVVNKKTDKRTYKENAIICARELCYGKDVTDKIISAKSDSEIERILAAARKGEI